MKIRRLTCVSGTLLKVTCPCSVRVYRSVHWTSHFLLGAIKTQPCLSGRVVWLDEGFHDHDREQFNAKLKFTQILSRPLKTAQESTLFIGINVIFPIVW